MRDIFESYGITPEECAGVEESLRKRPEDWVRFMMRFELGLEEPVPGRSWKSALTIASAYTVGGFIPLSAYLFVADAHSALKLSVVVTLAALALFGGVKGHFTGVPVLRSGLQTVLCMRFNGTLRRELLDHVVVLNEAHLRRLLKHFIAYYHEDRTHLALGKDAPKGRPEEIPPNADAIVDTLPRVGGLHHRYVWRDAA